jgi:hypothetical protein
MAEKMAWSDPTWSLLMVDEPSSLVWESLIWSDAFLCARRKRGRRSRTGPTMNPELRKRWR